MGLRRHTGQHTGPGHRQGAVRVRDRATVAAQRLVGTRGITRASADLVCGARHGRIQSAGRHQRPPARSTGDDDGTAFETGAAGDGHSY